MQEADGLRGGDGEYLAGREIREGKRGEVLQQASLLPCTRWSRPPPPAHQIPPVGCNMEGLSQAGSLRLSVFSDWPASQGGQEERPSSPVPLSLARTTSPGLRDLCTCEKATVRVSSSGPVIFSARSIHTWRGRQKGPRWAWGPTLGGSPSPAPPGDPLRLFPSIPTSCHRGRPQGALSCLTSMGAGVCVSPRLRPCGPPGCTIWMASRTTRPLSCRRKSRIWRREEAAEWAFWAPRAGERGQSLPPAACGTGTAPQPPATPV